MPHDKNGTLLAVGDLIQLLGRVKSIDSEQETYCNIVFLADRGMAPEHDAEGYALVLSARMVEKLDSSDLRPPPSAFPPIPFLFIDGHSRSNPVVTSGPLNVQFIYDEKLGKHVHRFASIDDFNARAPQICHDERMWKIAPGLEPAELVAPDASLLLENASLIAETENERDDAREILTACRAIAEGELTILDFPEDFRDHPAIVAVTDLADRLALIIAQSKPELGADSARPETAAPPFDFSGLREVEKIAFLCHEANRAYCASIGDPSQKPWPDAGPWQRESAVKGVEFFLSHPGAPEDAQHQAWMDDKLAAGWKFGPVKDAEKKEHPCLVPFAGLPPEQQTKDRLFQAVIRSLAGPFAPPQEDTKAAAKPPQPAKKKHGHK